VLSVGGYRRRGARGEGYFLGKGQAKGCEEGADVQMGVSDLVGEQCALEFALLNSVSSLSIKRLGGLCGSVAST
jgi:hypothetical protein